LVFLKSASSDHDERNELGTTLSTQTEYEKGDVLEVAVTGLARDFDDSIVWTRAKVIKKTGAKPTERKQLEKMAK
jgi:hypothetical protein